MLRPILQAYKGNRVFTVNPQYSNQRRRMTPVSRLARARPARAWRIACKAGVFAGFPRGLRRRAI
jgi:hypothetical protein